MSIEIFTPVGRIVQGHPFDFRDKDQHGKPLTDRTGNPRVQYFIALAVEKANPEVNALLGAMTQAADQAWPAIKPKGAHNFSFKIIDGDQAPHNTKEGFAGHYIFKFSSGYAPKVFDRGGAALITDRTRVKRGDYVRVAGNYTTNENQQKPGMYLNMAMIEFIGHGEEIASGPSGEIFNQHQVGYMPQGVSNTPTAPTVTNQQFAPQQQPQAPQQQPQAPQQQPQADYGFLQQPQGDGGNQFG